MEIVAESLRSHVSPLYWPYDAVQDARALAKVCACPELVDMVIDKVKNMRPPHTFAGRHVRIADVPRMFGVLLPEELEYPVRMPYPVLRRRLRLHYPTPTDFYRWFLPKQGLLAQSGDVTYEDTVDQLKRLTTD